MKRTLHTLLVSGLVILGVAGAVAGPGEAPLDSPESIGYVSLQVIEALTDNTLVQAIYSEVFDQLAGSGRDLLSVLAGLQSAAPVVVPEVTRRFSGPAEQRSYPEYRRIFISADRLKSGVEFHDRYRTLVHKISNSYGIDEYILLSIIGVESNFGRSHADFRVVDVFHTVAHDFPRKRNWVKRELYNFFDFCLSNKLDPGGVSGSYAGAIGYAQFMPSSLQAYGVDHNGDGRVDPYEWEDALESVANYLARHGYPRHSRDYSEGAPVWKALYAYNHSRNYVTVILEFRNELRQLVETGRG